MFNNLKANEIGLLLHGLRAVHVADEVKAHKKLTAALEAALAAKGLKLTEAYAIAQKPLPAKTTKK